MQIVEQTINFIYGRYGRVIAALSLEGRVASMPDGKTVRESVLSSEYSICQRSKE